MLFEDQPSKTFEFYEIIRQTMQILFVLDVLDCMNAQLPETAGV